MSVTSSDTADSGRSQSTSSGLPSLTSDVTDPDSLPYTRSTGPTVTSRTSLCNHLSGSSSTATLCPDDSSESSTETDDSSLTDRGCHFLEHMTRLENIHVDPLPSVDPAGWIRLSLDPDPWDPAYYQDDDQGENAVAEDGVLTHEMVRAGLSRMGQLPDTKGFVLTRLHLRGKRLTDAEVLADYRHLQVVDLSDNQLTHLRSLHSTYLLYLNVTGNRLTAALDMEPPAFLTRADLSHNLIRDMGDHLGRCWSLCHLDLSHNLIEHVRGLAGLRYLRYLNLAHNRISVAEGLACGSLERLDLSHNIVSDTDGLAGLTNVREINMTGNRLTSLSHFKDLYSMRRLCVGGNLVSELREADWLGGAAALTDLDLTDNPLTGHPGYRHYLVWRLAHLRHLDTVTVSAEERVAAKQLLRPDMVTRGDQLRVKAELWSQLAARPIDTADVPADRPPLPLVVLVGTFANGRDTVAKQLTAAYPQRVYRCRVYSTLCYDLDSVVSVVSEEEFSELVSTGRLLIHYRELGAAFGIGREELCRCVLEDKVCVMAVPLEAALALRSFVLRPLLVLAVTQDTPTYAERLRGLWGDLHPHPHHHTDTYEVKTDPETEDDQDPVSAVDQTTPSLSAYMDSRSKLDVEQTCDDQFVWSWSLESSRESLEPEPRDSVVAGERGRERLVSQLLREQETYLQLHNAQPGLFQESVVTDDVDKAVRKITNTCADIFKMREERHYMEERFKDLDCKEFLESRVSRLIEDLLNVSTEL